MRALVERCAGLTCLCVLAVLVGFWSCCVCRVLLMTCASSILYTDLLRSLGSLCSSQICGLPRRPLCTCGMGAALVSCAWRVRFFFLRADLCALTWLRDECMLACMRACSARARVRACVRACLRACSTTRFFGFFCAVCLCCQVCCAGRSCDVDSAELPICGVGYDACCVGSISFVVLFFRVG